MNLYKPNTNEEMTSEQEKATKALNELLLFTMSIKDQKKSSKHIWKQIDNLSTFIYKANIQFLPRGGEIPPHFFKRNKSMRRQKQKQLQTKINNYRILLSLITGITFGYILGAL